MSCWHQSHISQRYIIKCMVWQLSPDRNLYLILIGAEHWVKRNDHQHEKYTASFVYLGATMQITAAPMCSATTLQKVPFQHRGVTETLSKEIHQLANSTAFMSWVPSPHEQQGAAARREIRQIFLTRRSTWPHQSPAKIVQIGQCGFLTTTKKHTLT